MPEVTSIIKDIFIIYAAAKLAGEIFERLRQPAVVGELLVGVLIGPYALGLVGVPSEPLTQLFHNDTATAKEALHIVYEVLAQVGVIVLLFFVGLETRISEIATVGARALAVGVVGVAFPFVLGFGMASVVFNDNLLAAFLGTAMVATSVGITARVLRDMGVIAGREARIMLGAAMIDDILGLIILSIISGIGVGEANPVQIITVMASAIAFTAIATLIGTRIVKRYSLHMDRLRTSNAPFALAVICMFGLAALASYIGLAAIIGAFFAGMMLAEAEDHYELETKVLPVYELMTPFFFVVMGMNVDPMLFTDLNILGLSMAIIILAILGKVLGCGLASWGLGARSMAIIGFGMSPRGEVGLIVAGLGRSLGVIPESLLSAVVMMSIVTTVIAPPVLRLLYSGVKSVEAKRSSLLGRA